MAREQSFFDFAAEVGLTKHLGGLNATKSLIELCHISKESRVLDVGCGAGRTALYLARNVGCEVIGVDINAKMVQRSGELAEKSGISDSTHFRVADAQELPFDDDYFDAVFTESVTAFPEDKQKAVNEYTRVTKPGGYVGLNESTWMKTPPPPEIETWTSNELGGAANPLDAEGWASLLKSAGLIDIKSTSGPITMKDESKGILRRYGWGGVLGVVNRAIKLYAKNPGYRQFIKRIKNQGIAPDNLLEYFGYGIYVGRKQGYV